MNDNSRVTIALTKPEALVLFAYLSRITGASATETVLHPAEQAVLTDLLASLEKILAAPFQGNYTELVEDARNQVMDLH